MIGAEDGGSMTYSDTENQALAFVSYGLRPWLVVIEQALTADRDLFTPSTCCEFLIDGLRRADSSTRAAVYEKGSTRSPAGCAAMRCAAWSEALVSRTDLAELGLPRRAVDAVFRACPVVALPGFSRPFVKVANLLTNRIVTYETTYSGLGAGDA